MVKFTAGLYPRRHKLSAIIPPLGAVRRWDHLKLQISDFKSDAAGRRWNSQARTPALRSPYTVWIVFDRGNRGLR